MFTGLANIGSLLKNAQQIGTKLGAVQEQLKGQRVVGNAGGGMVEVEVNGLGEVLRLTIEPGLVERGEREMIEDLIPAAVNQAIGKSKQLHADAMREATDGLELPGLDEALVKFTGGGSDQPT